MDASDLLNKSAFAKLMLGIDCQIDRVEYQLVGFGREYRRYVIDYGTIPKHIAEPDCQAALDLLVERKWLNHCGRSMGVSLTAIDAGFSTDDVLNYARRYAPSKLIAVRGAQGDTAPRIAKVNRRGYRTMAAAMSSPSSAPDAPKVRPSSCAIGKEVRPAP